MPSTARMRRNAGHARTTEESRVNSAAASSEALMTRFRDHPSATAPTISIDTARQPVVSESARLLVAAFTWNSRVKIGSSGCTAYISRNTENPAANTARLIFQNAGVPRSTCGVATTAGLKVEGAAKLAVHHEDRLARKSGSDALIPD